MVELISPLSMTVKSGDTVTTSTRAERKFLARVTQRSKNNRHLIGGKIFLPPYFFLSYNDVMQTIYVRDDDKFEIKIEFSQEKFDEYLKQVGATKVEDITEQQTTELLHLVLGDYKKGTISLDGLSVICNELCTVLTHKPDTSRGLLGILMDTADLAYQERHGDMIKDLADFLDKA